MHTKTLVVGKATTGREAARIGESAEPPVEQGAEAIDIVAARDGGICLT